MAATSILIASPAGAVVTNACAETNNPAAQGNSSGLTVGCTFNSSGVSTAITITDYDNAAWNSSAVRSVTVKEAKTSGSTAGKTTIASAPTTSQAGITTADTNHSIEGLGIAPGSWIKIGGATTTLSKKTVVGGPACHSPANGATCTLANGGTTIVLIGNTTAREPIDGHTTAGSAAVAAVVTSATANFKVGTYPAGDVGMRISGGSLPDGATILSVDGPTQVTTQCVGCAGLNPYAGVVTCPTTPTCGAAVLTIAPATPSVSTRYVTDGSWTTGSHVISSASANFANTDKGLAVVGTGIPAGTKITVVTSATTVTTKGTTTTSTLTGGGSGKRFTLGGIAKSAPATNEVVGTLSIELQVNPALSPTSPPCAAGKISGFNIPTIWKNPGGYDLVSTLADFSGSSLPAVSTAQLAFSTSATKFAGFLIQNTTVTSGVATTTGYQVKYLFLPVVAGLCPGAGDATTWSFGGISQHQAANPTYTGPPGGAIRGLRDEPQGTTANYSGATGAEVTTGAAGFQPTNTNSCTVSSPNNLQVNCS